MIRLLITADSHERGAQIIRQTGLYPRHVIVATPTNARQAVAGVTPGSMERVGDSVEDWPEEARHWVYEASGWPA